MKILVTGATGFIGNYVVNELLKRGHAVIATSSNKEKASKTAWFKNVRYIAFDLAAFNDSSDYYIYFERPDLAIHLAWEGLPNYKSSFHEEINLPRHLSFLTNLVKNGLKDLTVAGTCFEYGMQEGCLLEEMPALPCNSYGRAKNSLRKGLQQLQSKFSYSFKWIRLFYVYGSGQNPKSLLSQLDTALEKGDTVFNMSGGEQVRDYLPVKTIAANIVSIALQKKVEGVINNCSGKPVTVKEFVIDYLIKKNKQISLNPGYYPYPDYEPMRFWGDITKLTSVLHND